MVTFKEIQKLFPAKLSKEAAKELDTIRKKMNSLKTEDEKKAYFEELKLKYAQSPTTETTQKEAISLINSIIYSVWNIGKTSINLCKCSNGTF